MEIIIIIAAAIGGIGYFMREGYNNHSTNLTKTESVFPVKWRVVLIEKVGFYNALSSEDKTSFEEDILYFFNHVTITGIDVTIDDTDKILVAASAVIPIFAFKEWHYHNLNEVLIYPNSFNHNFETAGKDRRILGMVGEGAMNGKMILSKKALHNGFLNVTDKNNTAIHEFVHLIDKTDGAIDGIPENLLGKQYVLPWINLIAEKIEEINKGKSDINPYGASSKTEFFAVASEYFFERPQLLKIKHPELYDLLEHVFKNDMSTMKIELKTQKIGRNDLCSCNSGEKYKNCCKNT